MPASRFRPAGAVVGAYVYFAVVEGVIAGELSVGDFGLLTAYFVHIVVSAQTLGTLWFRVQTSAAGLHRVFFLMDMEGEEDEPMGSVPVVERKVEVGDDAQESRKAVDMEKYGLVLPRLSLIVQ